MSTSESQVHLGLGKIKTVDKLTITWPDGKRQVINNITANQIIDLKQAEATLTRAVPDIQNTLFTEITDISGISFNHRENDFDDYSREILIPHKMSHLGPYLAVGDVDGNGLDDVYTGGAKDQSGKMYLQQVPGRFEESQNTVWQADAKCEDMGALLFDADEDGDLDLYVVSGGNEYPRNDNAYGDRLYLNNGQGVFHKSQNSIPAFNESGSCAVAGDMDGDGDMDLFIGGRQIPGQYPLPAKSRILENENGKFTDITSASAPELEMAGLVTSALWVDYDNDSDLDLIAVGEWMPITVFNNNHGHFEKAEGLNLENTEGWWNKIIAEDMDGDGDMDFVVGNLGLNIKYKASPEEPFEIFSHDFDDNGTLDIYLGYYEKGNLYPVRGRECSSQQMPFVTEKFPTFNEFSVATVDEVLGDKINEALHYQAKMFESVYLENNGNGFIIHKLPNRAQISTIFGIIAQDIDNDGILDLIISGNYYEREVETTRSDASIGLVLIHDGKGNFKPIDPVKTGLTAYKDVRDMQWAGSVSDKDILIIANNNDRIQVYQFNKAKTMAQNKP